jgi:hypothetical protein
MDRRSFLTGLAGCALAAATATPAGAEQSRITSLILESAALPAIADRMNVISRGLLGTRYRGYSLIGGPAKPEVMVTRDDGFDCVTFCETVLAAALARRPEMFEPALQHIRYRHGFVNWYERNHYHHDWSERNVAAGVCRAIDVPGAVTISKTVHWHRALGRRRFAMSVIPRERFLAHRAALMHGDIVGFVTRRPNLDYFHTGLVAFGAKGELLLRHASRSHWRVLDEPMERFMSINRVRYVTVLRPQNDAAEAMPWLTAKHASK